jgi:hypothetical protein
MSDLEFTSLRGFVEEHEMCDPSAVAVPQIPTSLWVPPVRMPKRWEANEGEMPMVKAAEFDGGDRDQSLLADGLDPETFHHEHSDESQDCVAYDAMKKAAAVIAASFADLLDEMDRAVQKGAEVEYQQVRLAYHKLVHDLFYPHEGPKCVTRYGIVLRGLEVWPTIRHGRLHGVLVKIYWNPHSSSSLVYR